LKVRKETEKGRSTKLPPGCGGGERGIRMVAAVLKAGKIKRNKNEGRKEGKFAKECEGARNIDTRVGGKYKRG
jgi:hypothetical protein